MAETVWFWIRIFLQELKPSVVPCFEALESYQFILEDVLWIIK
jgi:hypothetical protein